MNIQYYSNKESTNIGVTYSGIILVIFVHLLGLIYNVILKHHSKTFSYLLQFSSVKEDKFKLLRLEQL